MVTTRRGAGSIGLLSLTAFLAIGPTNVASESSARAAEPASSSPLPAPALSLSVQPSTGSGPWKVRIENTGELPIRLSADPRLLVLELTKPASPAPSSAAANKAKASKASGPETLRCVLPSDTWPTTDEGSDLVVPGKRSWSATFDPLFYCFGARERAALAPGTVVKPTFGFPPKTARSAKAAPPAQTAPFVASPVGAAVGSVAPAKILEGASFTLTDGAAATPPSVGVGATSTPSTAPPVNELGGAAGAAAAPGAIATTGVSTETTTKSPLSLSMPTSLDVLRGTDLPTSVTLENGGDRATTLFFRPTTLGFTVNGPSGSVRCGSPLDLGSPIRELFTTVGAKGRASVSLLLGAICPDGTFDAPGVYRVVPRLDTTGASGRPVGLKTWDGEVTGSTPLLVRVRRSRRPEPPVRPSLD